MNRLAEILNELKELNRKITALGNVEKRKPFSLKSDLDHIANLKKVKQELREEIDTLESQ
jgi:hypothetical protein